MKEFIEKLIGRLDEYSSKKMYVTMFNHAKREGYSEGVSDSKQIIRQLAEEFATDIEFDDNGWIYCSERLPETCEDVLCWYEYFRFGEYNEMYETYGIGHYWKEGKMWGGEVAQGHKCRVIAWQPLPKAPESNKERKG